MDYLPKHATIEQACNWLLLKTGQPWILARLLECGLTPWFWFDYTPGWPAVFGDKVEGYLAPIVFNADTQRLEADGTDALVSMTRTHDGIPMRLEPAIRFPISNLRFKREDVTELANLINQESMAKAYSETAPPGSRQAATPDPAPAEAQAVTQAAPAWREQAQEQAKTIIKRQKARDLYPSQMDIADEVAKTLRAKRMFGDKGKPLPGAYIKRHALKGISSAASKLQSTGIHRGK